MADKKVIAETGLLTMTDEKGKSFSIAEISDITLFTHGEPIVLGEKNIDSVECKLEIKAKNTLHLRHEIFKARRRSKKIINGIKNGSCPLKFTLALRGFGGK